MTLDKRAREQMLALCGEIHDDDGVDPREFFKPKRDTKKEDHKTKQLCRQVQRTLELVLSGETGDDLLCGLCVTTVVPASGASRLLVTVQVNCKPEDFDPALVEQRLAFCSGHFRREVAAAITRRKTPTLLFRVVGPNGVKSEPTEEDSQ